MAQIIWDGNKNWENVWDGKQPWDREIEEKSIPENAVLIDRPDDIITKRRSSCIVRLYPKNGRRHECSGQAHSHSQFGLSVATERP